MGESRGIKGSVSWNATATNVEAFGRVQAQSPVHSSDVWSPHRDGDAVRAQGSVPNQRVRFNTQILSPDFPQRATSDSGCHSEIPSRMLEVEDEQFIRFGSLSLGDIAVRDFYDLERLSKNQAVVRLSALTESFDSRIHDCHRGMNEWEQRSSPEIRNRDSQCGGSGCKTNTGSLVRAESSKPAYPFGTCVDDVYQSQCWTNREGEWFWVPKATALYTIEKNLGFPATAEEIRRFHP